MNSVLTNNGLNLLTFGSVLGLDVVWGIIIIIVFIVYNYVWNFHGWYIGSEVSLLSFSYTYGMFIIGIVMYLLGNIMVMVWGWEFIGLMSILLIGFWGRSEAYSGSYAAVLYNRLGDVGIMYLLIAMDAQYVWLPVCVAMLSNSAVWIFGYWLPIAMESPTPVSSLLHSSTMVVAGVFLGMLYMEMNLLLPILGISIMSLYLSGWYDGNKIIALSTSVHLVVILCAIGLGMYGLVVFHIVTHSFVKASAFVNSGWYIHMDGSQDLRAWGVNLPVIIIIIGFVFLASVGGSLVSASNEYILLGAFSVVVIVMGWVYSNNFMNNVDGNNSKYLIDSGFMFLVLLTGSLSFSSIDTVIFVFVCVGMRVITISNMWIVNR